MARRSTFLIGALLICILAQARPFGQVRSGRLVLKMEPYVFEAAGEKIDAEMGWLEVPQNRARPDGGKVGLPIVRFKSTTWTSAAPIVFLNGGPGNSGINAARGPAASLLKQLRQTADVI